MKKRGSHIGIMLSFVIFITFLIFLYAIVQPTINLDEKRNLLEIVESEIIKKSSEDLTSISVAFSGSKTCIELKNFFNITEIGEKVIARNDAGNVLTVAESGGSLFIEGNMEGFIKVHESEEFAIISDDPPDTNPCPPLNRGNNGYVLGLVKTNRQIFETKIIKLINDYGTDYELLKEEIGVGLGDEFGFGFTYNNGTVIKTKETNVSVSVYADEIQINYISENAALESGFLSVKVW